MAEDLPVTRVTPQGVMGAWIAAGMLAGIAVGVWTGHLFIGIFVGVAAGLALGAGLSRKAPAGRVEPSDREPPPQRRL